MEDHIREWTGLEFTKVQRAAENREEWRELVVKSSVVPRCPRGQGIGGGEERRERHAIRETERQTDRQTDRRGGGSYPTNILILRELRRMQTLIQVL